MVEFQKNNPRQSITIPLSGKDELQRYRQGLRGLLRKIEIENCDPELKENLKAVYELLSHLQPAHSQVSNGEDSLQELNQNIRKN